MKKLINSLETAEGRSEFVIAVACDIRGFSEFSTTHESPDLAMFIKRFYLKLLQVYFKDAVFAKPTGDGLLVIFKYSEKTLGIVTEQVLSTCFQVLNDFPSMFQEDPMINFPTPSDLGFGLARGTACCLFSKKSIIDYSGQLLNLAARLNDLARPKGIVIDGSYSESVLPQQFRTHFKKKRAYIKSISEETPRDILCSDTVSLPLYARNPLTSTEWKMDRKTMKASAISMLDSNLIMGLSKEVLSIEKAKLELSYPNTKMPGYTYYLLYTSYTHVKDAKGSRLSINLNRAKTLILEESIPPDADLAFEFQYIPKPGRASRGRA